MPETVTEFPISSEFPKLGESGLFRMTMYRGIKSEPLHSEFASDPGDYGRGEYWAATREFANHYGPEIICKNICLTNALRLASEEIGRTARERGFTVLENGHAARLAAAQSFTEEMLENGYDGIVVKGYELPGLWSACVFLR